MGSPFPTKSKGHFLETFLGRAGIPASIVHQKITAYRMGRIRVQCQTIEPHCTLLPVNAFGLRSIDGSPAVFNWAWSDDLCSIQAHQLFLRL
jgi:hypothetical protein